MKKIVDYQYLLNAPDTEVGTDVSCPPSPLATHARTGYICPYLGLSHLFVISRVSLKRAF